MRRVLFSIKTTGKPGRLGFKANPFPQYDFLRSNIPAFSFSTSNMNKSEPKPKVELPIFSSEYYTKTKAHAVMLNQEKVKHEYDLKNAYDEYLSFLKSREISEKLKCKSCGTGPLQSNDSGSDKYYKPPKFSAQIGFKKNIGHLQKNQLFTEAELALKKEMGIYDEASNLAEEKEIVFEQKVKQLAELANSKVECLRCQQLNSHGVFDIFGQQIDQVLEKIPSNGKIVNIVSILDFPLSCSKGIIKGRDPKDIWHVVTKADLFFRQEVQLNRTGLQYVQEVLEKYLDADPEKVFFVSTTKSWNNEELLQKLPGGDLYFVGRANAGKSSLIKSLIASTHGVDTQNVLAKKIEKKSMNYLEKLGLDSPGTSHIPGYTRDFQKFKINDRITVYDTPGIFPNDLGFYKYLTEKLARKQPKYTAFVAEDKKRYKKLDVKGPKVFSGKSLYSYGGFFYLQPPKGAIFKRCLAFKLGEKTFEARYSKLGRAEEINETRPKQIGNRFGVTKEAFYNLKRYVIPPFYGTVDIVIQDLGFLSIKMTSSPDDVDGLFQIWVPEGVRVIVRESIFNFLYKSHDLVDETGNKLKKENISKRGATRLRAIFDEDKLHFTELVQVPVNESDEQAFLSVCPPGDMKISNTADSQEEYKNQYWRKIKI
ncbi:hypothetical protein PICMEDRAFT_15909 [Pichia membranifaciens NRRL Y-2026]|uniref:Genetic interactor of prohibitins 3, mitochondrial n=1 Tax=Pichia membranifaciens NRRL Y-2026 TaxID=763406 RepID=A0A1E3NPV3_9ASCO|nr:hypothetical protein PICMEDRAFT_15909 [Pichia membranifaciens NRRL Y-2026]ODQ48066.1 hypothetical protein PICMEDRAFT_15909 [Pichia membranifaciens NRRL Y-2026]